MRARLSMLAIVVALASVGFTRRHGGTETRSFSIWQSEGGTIQEKLRGSVPPYLRVKETAADSWLQTPKPRNYTAYRSSVPPVIDGRLDDAAWRDAPWTDLFVDIEGDTKPRPRFDTRAKLLWDDDYFYVGAELQEPHIWATMTEHDSVIFHDPDFEVFIDPNGDTLEYYEFEINARGTYWDLFLPKPYRAGGKAQNSWEIPGLKSAVWVDGTLNDARDTDRGWSVELAFPWKVLGEFAHRPAPPHDGDEWRVNFSRVEWPIETTGGAYRKPAGAHEDNWVWSPQGVVDMHRPETWGIVRFAEKVRSQRSKVMSGAQRRTTPPTSDL